MVILLWKVQRRHNVTTALCVQLSTFKRHVIALTSSPRTKRSRTNVKRAITLCSSAQNRKAAVLNFLVASSWKCRSVILLSFHVNFQTQISRQTIWHIVINNDHWHQLLSRNYDENRTVYEIFSQISTCMSRGVAAKQRRIEKKLFARKRKENWKSGRKCLWQISSKVNMQRI